MGLASRATLLGLYNMVMKYPSRDDMVRSVHMWASYRGDQKGAECSPSSCATFSVASRRLVLALRNLSERRTSLGMKACSIGVSEHDETVACGSCQVPDPQDSNFAWQRVAHPGWC